MKKLLLTGSIAALALGNGIRADGAALSLDGVDDWVEITGGTGVIPSGSAPFTIGAWVNPDVHGDRTMTFWGTQGPAGAANGFRLRGGDGTRHYFWGNDNDQTTGDLSSDTSGPNGDGWHHLAVTYDGTLGQWYWNGAPLGPAFNHGSVSVADANHRIGSRLDAEFFDGLIDEISIWGVALDAPTIAAGWNLPIDLNAPGVDQALIAYYNFENGFGDSATLGGAQDGVAMGGAFIEQNANAPVPEPASAVLAVLGALLLFRRRR